MRATHGDVPGKVHTASPTTYLSVQEASSGPHHVLCECVRACNPKCVRDPLCCLFAGVGVSTQPCRHHISLHSTEEDGSSDEKSTTKRGMGQLM